MRWAAFLLAAAAVMVLCFLILGEWLLPLLGLGDAWAGVVAAAVGGGLIAAALPRLLGRFGPR